MSSQKVLLLLVFLLAISTTVSAATRGDQIQAFVASTQLDAMLYDAQMQNGEYAAADKTRDQAEKDLDVAIKKAISQAHGYPDLTAALKRFYVAEQAFLEHAWLMDGPAFMVQQQSQALKQKADEAASAVNLEAKLIDSNP